MRNKYYDILGINKTANEKTIKKAYRNLALKYHPDKNIENKDLSEKKFKEVNEAYSILSNKEKRRIYDNFGTDGLRNNFSDVSAFNFSEFNPFSKFSNFNPFYENSFHLAKYTQIILKQLNKSDLNGRIGKIESFNRLTSRYTILLPKERRKISVQFKNIQQLVPVQITNIESQIYKKGCIIGFLTKKDRYIIKIFNAEKTKRIALKKQNIVLSKNTLVLIKLVGLNSQRFNGMFGRIDKYDYNIERYIVTLENNKKIRIKNENLIF